MATVDGKTTAPDSRNIVQGDGGDVDKIAGGSGNDIMQGNAEFNQYYGGAGNDTFKIMAHVAQSQGTHVGQSTLFADQFAYITDFQGAGVAGGDFVAFDGFDGNTLTMEHKGVSGTSGATLYYYSVEDFQGHTYNFIINSLNGKELGKGDFGFYNVPSFMPV
ncbi:MAG: hypothetical protein PGN23_12610 [Sphingomonas adhaesiva]|uniref:hypothetical protein n=1 Tax=Sphingomonas adhaesiva TaxID=28212 RepID=UPI002FF6F81D